MAAPSLLLDFAIVLIAAEIGGTTFRYLRLPAVVGMLVAGIALGPFTPGYVVDLREIEDLALLGAVFLMFSTGLSFDIRGFRKLGVWPFVLAGTGVASSFALGFLIGIVAGWPLIPSLFVGLILTSTSTTLGLKFLADFGLTGEKGSDLVVAAILIDDVVALSLMTFVVGIAAPVPVAPGVLLAGLAAILGLAIATILVSRHALPRILRATDKRSPSSTVMIAISFALLISFGFAVLGLPPLVGAFFAGSIVASTEYGPRVARHMVPVTAIFMAVFFASIGLLIDPTRVVGVLGIALGLVAAAVIAKVVPGVLVIRRVTRQPVGTAWRLSTALIPRAEISLIIAQFGIAIGGPPELLALAMAVMIGTAVLPQPLARAARPRAARESTP